MTGYALRSVATLAITGVLHAEELPALPAGEDWAEKVATSLSTSVVRVYQYNSEDRLTGTGSGFCLSHDGLIATCLHVIGESRRVVVELPDGTHHEPNEVVAVDRHLDLAIIRIPHQDLIPLPLGPEEDSLKRGEAVATMGNPLGSDRALATGVVGVPTQLLHGVRHLQVNIPVEHGNSGGPLVDQLGRVRGVFTAKSATMMNIGFAVDSEYLRDLLKNPSPVGIDHWMKIAKLPAENWLGTPATHWQRRGGRIEWRAGVEPRAATSGTCEWRGDYPAIPFEIAVDMKIEGGQGTAGVLLMSPSQKAVRAWFPAGSEMILTEATGKGLKMKSVLGRARARSYRVDDWNRVRIRVLEGGIRCFLNDEELYHHAGGHRKSPGENIFAGLIVMEHRTASFKNFTLLPLPPPGAQVRAPINLPSGLASGSSPDAELNPMHLKNLPGGPEQHLEAIDQRCLELENTIRRLRHLGMRVSEQAITTELENALQGEGDQIPLVRSALQILRLGDGSLKPRTFLYQFEQILEEVMQALPEEDTEVDKAAVLRDVLYRNNGMHVARFPNADRDLSLLDMRILFEDREASVLPLTLLILELGGRIGLEVEATDLSGFLLLPAAREGGKERLLHVCDGTIGTIEDLQKTSPCLKACSAEQIRQFLQPKKAAALLLEYLALLKNEIPLSPPIEWAEKISPYLRVLRKLDPGSSEARIELAIAQAIQQPTSEAKEQVLSILHESGDRYFDTARVLHIFTAWGLDLSRANRPEE